VVAPALSIAVLHMINAIILFSFCIVGVVSLFVSERRKMTLMHVFIWGLGLNIVVLMLLTLFSPLNLNWGNEYQYTDFIVYSSVTLGLVVGLNGLLMILSGVNIKKLRRGAAASVSIIMS
jgi:energy-coupling factor transporter transmembrane protein EcfT